MEIGRSLLLGNSTPGFSTLLFTASSYLYHATPSYFLKRNLSAESDFRFPDLSLNGLFLLLRENLRDQILCSQILLYTGSFYFYYGIFSPGSDFRFHYLSLNRFLPRLLSNLLSGIRLPVPESFSKWILSTSTLGSSLRDQTPFFWIFFLHRLSPLLLFNLLFGIRFPVPGSFS